MEELKKTGAEVVGRRLAVRDGWSGPAVAGISAVVARVVMCRAIEHWCSVGLCRRVPGLGWWLSS